MGELLTAKAYAKKRGVSLSSVQWAIASERITTVMNEQGAVRIDPDVADREWEENTQHEKRNTMAGKSYKDLAEKSPELKLSFNEARTLKETYMAKLAQLDYDVKIGKLVSAEEVKNKVFQAARVTRDAILNIPDRIAGELAAETDYHRVYDLLKRELQQALEEMADASKL